MRRLLRPAASDIRTVAFHTGRLLAVIGFAMVVPIVAALLLGEWPVVGALTGSAGATLAVGALMRAASGRPAHARLTWANGLVSVACVWLVGPVFGTLPLFLTGFYPSFLDAYFDGMSALTTSGLALVQDLDHLPESLNLWRHLMQFLGGQGIVIVMLSLAGSASGNLSTLYAGEGRDEAILPSVIRTARFIARVSATFLAIGVPTLWITLRLAGMQPVRALLHALELFMAGYSTGGFAPMSTSVGYYHSASVEFVLAPLMLAGATSFVLHHHLWRRDRRELLVNSETRTFALTLGTFTTLTVVGLVRAGVYTDTWSLVRKGVFTAFSAHTTTGFAVFPGRGFVTQWASLAPAMIVGAMSLGAMAMSTGGGLKVVRVTVAIKALGEEIRRLLLPDSALVVTRYHVGRDRILRDGEVRAATLVGLLFLLTYLGGGLVGLFFGFGFEEAMFESTSAAGTVGLTSGLLGPDTPTTLKLVYTLQMWLGRLEFLACFVLLGYIVAAVRGRR